MVVRASRDQESTCRRFSSQQPRIDRQVSSLRIVRVDRLHAIDACVLQLIEEARPVLNPHQTRMRNGDCSARGFQNANRVAVVRFINGMITRTSFANQGRERFLEVVRRSLFHEHACEVRTPDVAISGHSAHLVVLDVNAQMIPAE